MDETYDRHVEYKPAPIVTEPVIRGVSFKPVLEIPTVILPATGFPEGKIRFRFRHNSVGKAFVKTADGIRAFVIGIKDGAWTPGPEIARTVRTENSKAVMRWNGGI